MKKLSKPRLIIRFVAILLGIAALFACGIVIDTQSRYTSQAVNTENIETTSEEEPLSTDVELVTLVFEPIEYDIPLETEQEPIKEIEDESTEIYTETETEQPTYFEEPQEYVEPETTYVEVVEEPPVYEPEVTTPISETILIDFSEEEWETTYSMVVDQYNEEIQMIAKVVLLEAGGIAIYDHKAAIVWTICNRWDAGYGSIYEIITAPHQYAYNPYAEVRSDLWTIAVDVLTRWTLEKQGHIDVGRVLPSDYLWYWGDGTYNWFRNVYEDGSNPWNWSLPSPYYN